MAGATSRTIILTIARSEPQAVSPIVARIRRSVKIPKQNRPEDSLARLEADQVARRNKKRIR